MADNAFVKIGTALLKHQVKKLVGEEALGAIGEELASIGGDKLDAWLGDKSTRDEIEKAAIKARDNFRGRVNDDEVEQWMAMLPIDNLPDVLAAIEELPTSPDETKLETALRESIALNWKRLSPAQVDNTVNAFMFCLRNALLPINDQALPAIGRAVFRIEDKVDKLGESIEKLQVGTAEKPAPERKQKVSLAKLPSTSPDLFGREDRLRELDAAWDSGSSVIASEAKQSPSGEGIASTEERRLAMTKINIFSLVAWGGVGKSALVNKWLTQMGRDNYRGAERVYGWSFYSQGAAEGRQVSADQFIAAALTWFGDPDPTAGSPWDKGERLAELVKQSRTLLILDGLEPLQNPPPVEMGRIKDPALVSFLREVARQNPGLVVITTRLAVDDLKDFKDGSAKETDLESLSDESGAAYLKHLGVDGTDAERQQASHDFGGHALALTLLGRYLKVVHNGDIRKRGEIPHVMDEQKQGAHASRVMESYEHWLQGKPELDILRLMGLFDRPAEKGALDALRKEPVISGLTDTLQKLSEANWKYAVNDLRELRLITPQDPHTPDELDCHPLLREHFGEKLKAENGRAWQEAHDRLYAYYKSTAKELPETLEEMAPLYAAVMHGCQAGKYQKAFDEVYWKRITRESEFFATKHLGAIGADFAVLSVFFGDTLWREPVDGLSEYSRGLILNQTGLALRSLGRLLESIEPFQASRTMAIAKQWWENATRTTINISQTYTILGFLGEATEYAKESIKYADQSKDAPHRRGAHVALAHTLHLAGQFSEAELLFGEAENIQKHFQPYMPFLYSGEGFDYCELLLSQGKYADVERRIANSIKWRETGDSLIDIAHEDLCLGRAYLLNPQRKSKHSLAKALININLAISNLRRARQQPELPLGLLARAEYYRLTGDFVKAQKDVDEAFTIATRGGMGLFLADCHLEFARLKVAKSKVEGQTTDNGRRTMDEARGHLKTAKEMINKMGYHRRDKEVEELEKELG